MAYILNKIKGYLMDKKYEKKEAALTAKRAALEAAYEHAVPVLTVAAMTSVALAGQFSFM